MLIHLKGYHDVSVIKSLLADCMWPDDEKISQELHKYFTDGTRQLFGKTVNHELIGLIGIIQLPGSEAELKHIAVRSDYRNQGIGKEMLREYIRNNRIAKMTAETDMDAVHFYRKIGFEISSLGEKYPGVERFQCTLLNHELIIRLYEPPDTERIVAMINRDPYHMLNGITAERFEQDLDEPGERIRDNTFVVQLGHATVGYFSLCFVGRNSELTVYCYGTVDVDWRRRGIGTAIFTFIFDRLEGIARQERKTIRFVHRALTSIPGEIAITIPLGMQEQNSLDILCLNDMKDMSCSKLPSDYYFRAPTFDDAGDWADIYNDAFGGDKSVQSVIHEFQGSDFSQNLYILCIHKTKGPVGLVCSTVRGAYARIPTIAVKREWHRRGIGEAMLSELLQRLKYAGAAEVRLSVESNNRAAKTLYGKFGFQPEYRRIHYVASFPSSK